MSDKEVSSDEDSDEFKKSMEASEKAIKSSGVALWNFAKGSWEWVERQNPFVQLLFTLPVAKALEIIFTPFASWFYLTFWEKPVIISGSLYVSGLPIPLSWTIYVIFGLLYLSMRSNYRNRKRIQELEEKLSE